jgi:DNA gyrase subunit B
MTRDLAAEIDQLKAEFQAIQHYLLHHLPPTEPLVSPAAQDLLTPASRDLLNALRDQLLAYSTSQNASGAVAYTGTFRSGEGQSAQQSIWASMTPTADLLSLNQHRLVEKVLASVGNSQRLAILLALLQQPASVTQLMQHTGANTTGQIYHHLKPLLAADLVQEEKGVYAIVPHRVQGLIMLLAGVHDLLDPRYTSGDWEA